ncbi:MAG: flagellar filament capping protein FliD, partial [Sedimenticola sp.]|nr:flagellar filament capping protein FliD [Sedimenticola sp.]
GLGSGLDVNSIISSLMAIEERPLTLLNQKEATVQAEISAMGSLKSALSNLQSSLTALGKEDTFRSTSTQSSDSTVFTATSSTTATSANYAVTVNRLAQAHKVGSSALSGTATFGGAAGDKLTITVDSKSFDVDLSTAKTLSQIQSAINVDLNTTGVTAGLITGDSGQQTLTLTASETGYDKRVQLSYGGAINASTFNFSMLNRDSDDVLLLAESELDSSVTIDGVSVTRASNSITDAVAGLTLELKKKGSANATISADSSGATNAVSGFVSALNDVLTQIQSTSSGGLGNSSVMRSIEFQISSILNARQTGFGDYSFLSQMGITTKEGGGLTFDSAKLKTALADDIDDVINFFTDTTKGFETRMDSMLDSFLQSGGVIDSIVNGAKNEVTTITRNRSLLEQRLESTEARLRNQFESLDTLMSSMQTTSSYLTSQLESIANLTNRNNS